MGRPRLFMASGGRCTTGVGRGYLELCVGRYEILFAGFLLALIGGTYTSDLAS